MTARVKIVQRSALLLATLIALLFFASDCECVPEGDGGGWNVGTTR